MSFAVHMNVCPGSSVPTVPNHPEVPSGAFAVGSQARVFPESVAARTVAAAWSKLVSTGSRFSESRAAHALVSLLTVSPAGTGHDVEFGALRSMGPPHPVTDRTCSQVAVPL